MKLIQRGLFRLCFSTIVLIKIKTRYILKKEAFKKYKVPATCEGFVASLKSLQHNFPKMRGGVQGRLELFRKFIRFGRGKLPLRITDQVFHSQVLQQYCDYSTASHNLLNFLARSRVEV